MEKEEQRALTTVHNLALGLSSEGLGVKWVTGGITEHYELWELIGLEPNEEVVVTRRTSSPGPKRNGRGPASTADSTSAGPSLYPSYSLHSSPHAALSPPPAVSS